MRKHCGNCANYRKETNQFSEECGKCVSARLKNGETTDPSHWRALPQTNADRIRAMSDEALAEFLESTHSQMAIKLGGEYIVRAKEYIGIWLKQPAE